MAILLSSHVIQGSICELQAALYYMYLHSASPCPMIGYCSHEPLVSESKSVTLVSFAAGAYNGYEEHEPNGVK